MPGTILATEDGRAVSATNPLPVSATFTSGDIEIGAVELKSGTDDTRATVDPTYGLGVDIKRNVPLVAGAAVIGKVGIDQTTGQNLIAQAAIVPTNDTATILTGATGLSDSIDLLGRALLGYIMPATWVAAGITFRFSQDNVNFYDVYDITGTEVSHVVSATRHVMVNPANFIGFRYIKLRSGTSGTPVDQTATRAIILVSKAV